MVQRSSRENWALLGSFAAQMGGVVNRYGKATSVEWSIHGRHCSEILGGLSGFLAIKKKQAEAVTRWQRNRDTYSLVEGDERGRVLSVSPAITLLARRCLTDMTKAREIKTSGLPKRRLLLTVSP